MKFFFFPLLLLVGCAPVSLEELRCEGEAAVKQLTLELKKLESHEDVQKASKRLKKHFNRIAELLIETRNFPYPSGELPEIPGAEELFAELARIYEIPGGRAAIESTQNEGVHRLDRAKVRSI